MKITLTVVLVIVLLVGGIYLVKKYKILDKFLKKPAVNNTVGTEEEIPSVQDNRTLPRISDLDPQLEQYYQSWHGTNTV